MSSTANCNFLLQVDFILIGQSKLDQPIRMLEQQLSFPHTSWRRYRRQYVMESNTFVEGLDSMNVKKNWRFSSAVNRP